MSYFTGAKSCHGQLYPRNSNLGGRCVPIVSTASMLLEDSEALGLRASSSSAQPLLSLNLTMEYYGLLLVLGNSTVYCLLYIQQ